MESPQHWQCYRSPPSLSWSSFERIRPWLLPWTSASSPSYARLTNSSALDVSDLKQNVSRGSVFMARLLAHQPMHAISRHKKVLSSAQWLPLPLSFGLEADRSVARFDQ
ncbi:putative FAD-linked oxidoreductase YvdP [Fusarium oxysporum f. sp. albedinis]|nr:putative FAD-linked oxidoreductase YvdP [Fusarium oxysporum f. sp. albedinis]